MLHPSAFTPTFMPIRPGGTDWVAYHDVEAATNIPGLAMTWRGPDGFLRYAVVFDRAFDGRVAMAGRIGEDHDVMEALGEARRGARSSLSDNAALSMLLPHGGSRGATSSTLAVDAHVALARRALAQARLRQPMREALEACLDHGVPTDVSLEAMRRKTRSPEWPTLALAASDPTLVRTVLACEKDLLSGTDPLASIRRRWPGLTDAHRRRLRDSEGFFTGFNRSYATPSMDLLTACPVDWWPTRAAWPAFVACARTLQSVRRSCPDGTTLRALADASGGDWDALYARLRRAADVESVMGDARLVNRGSDCLDPIKAMAAVALLPILAGREDDASVERLERSLAAPGQPTDALHSDRRAMDVAVSCAKGLLYGDKAAAAILETSREWHLRRDSMEAEVRGDDGAAAWPPLFEGVFRDGDVGVVAVADYAGLRDEGRVGEDRDGVEGLDHCVASRLSECLSGQAHVLSVRLYEADGAWRRLSTCQVSTEGTRDCQVSAEGTRDGRALVSVVEHRGAGNADPEEKAVAAVARLVEAFGTGRVVALAEALASRRPGHGLDAVCGYDWRDPKAVANALRTWRPFMPRWARDLGPEGLLRALVDRGIVSEPETEFEDAPSRRP